MKAGTAEKQFANTVAQELDVGNMLQDLETELYKAG